MYNTMLYKAITIILYLVPVPVTPIGSLGTIQSTISYNIIQIQLPYSLQYGD